MNYKLYIIFIDKNKIWYSLIKYIFINNIMINRMTLNKEGNSLVVSLFLSVWQLWIHNGIILKMTQYSIQILELHIQMALTQKK